jgi:hypothetical protein
MPNLDELTHDMEFIIGGEKFVVHDVPPDVLMTMEEVVEPEEGEEEKGALDRVDEQIVMFLNGDADQVERYKAMRARTENPVPLWKLLEFRRLLWETQSNRPTNEPSGSASGRGRTVRTSEAA